MSLMFSRARAAARMGRGALDARRATTPPRYDRLCEALLRQIPLAMVAVTSAAAGFIALGDGVPMQARPPLRVLFVLVLVCAVVRQTQQLRDRDRMLTAERDVAEGRAQLQHLAHHDPLTGLPNRMLLRDRVTQALATAARRGEKVALMFIDLDRFKEVNDTLGHAIGDALLCHVAARVHADAARGGHRLPPGRRRVRDRADRRRLAGRRVAGGRTRDDAVEPARGHRRPRAADVDVGGHRDVPEGRRRLRGPDAVRRHRDVPRQGRRPQRLPLLRRADERRGRASARACAGCSRTRSSATSCTCTSSPTSTCAAASSPAPRCCCAGRRPSSARSARTSSSRWPRTAARSSRSAPGCCARPARRPRRGCARACALPRVAVNLSILQFRHGDLVQQVADALRDAGPAAAPAGARDHRVGADARRPTRCSPPPTASRRWACAWPSTTSAPATPASPTCSGSASTSSRSTSPSCATRSTSTEHARPSCAPSSTWRARWSSRSSPRASRPPAERDFLDAPRLRDGPGLPVRAPDAGRAVRGLPGRARDARPSARTRGRPTAGVFPVPS